MVTHAIEVLGRLVILIGTDTPGGLVPLPLMILDEWKTALNVLFYAGFMRASARLVAWCALPEVASTN